MRVIRPPLSGPPDTCASRLPSAPRARRRGPRSADALHRRSQVHLEHVSPQGIGSADSEPTMPSRKIVPFNIIILDHINLRGFIRHNGELQGHLDLK